MPADFLNLYSKLQDRVRRLELRTFEAGGAADPVEDYQDMEPYLAPGWGEAGSDPASGLKPRFYRDRQRVWLAGLIIYDATAPGADANVPLLMFPSGYRPVVLQNFMWACDMDGPSTSPSVASKFWTGEYLSTGLSMVSFDPNPGFSASPNFGNPPDSASFILDGASYRHA